MLMTHVAMYVESLEETRDFFIKYFGAEVNDGYQNLKTGFKSCVLSFSDGTRLKLMTLPELEWRDNSGRKSGYTYIAMSVGSREEVENLGDKLLEDGYDMVKAPGMTGEGCYECSVFDPEGNLIVITT